MSISRLKLSRRLSVDLELFTKKRPIQTRNKPIRQYSIFNLQLIEKQRIKYQYHLNEAYLKKLSHKLSVSTCCSLYLSFITPIERKLDNVLYQSNFTLTRAHARQLINHGKLLVNHTRHTISSTIINHNDIIVLLNIPTNKPIPLWFKFTTLGYLFNLPMFTLFIKSKLDLSLVIAYYTKF